MWVGSGKVKLKDLVLPSRASQLAGVTGAILTLVLRRCAQVRSPGAPKRSTGYAQNSERSRDLKCLEIHVRTL